MAIIIFKRCPSISLKRSQIAVSSGISGVQEFISILLYLNVFFSGVFMYIFAIRSSFTLIQSGLQFFFLKINPLLQELLLLLHFFPSGKPEFPFFTEILQFFQPLCKTLISFISCRIITSCVTPCNFPVQPFSDRKNSVFFRQLPEMRT